MNKISKYTLIIMIALFLVNVTYAQTATSTPVTFVVPEKVSEILVSRDGSAKLTGLKVMQRANNTYFTRMYWGDMFIRMVIRSSDKTMLVSRFNEPLKVTDVKDGDILNVEGELFPSQNDFSVTGLKIVNMSYDKSREQFSGTVSSVSMPHSFILNTIVGQINVNISTTTSVSKGSRQNYGSLLLMNTDDKVTSVSGILDRGANILNANSVSIFFDFNLLKAQNFRGILVEGPNLDSRVLRVLMSDGRTATVKLDPEASVLNSKRKNTLLSRYAKDDSIIFYGAREEADLNTIHAEIVRNLDL
ncbi:MAG: hypothetical protein HZA95_00185 [Candidatus Vogelbacteria bacterium]|nr:hypothetical protein [Candidatus Vogelbacteria bacterium]